MTFDDVKDFKCCGGVHCGKGVLTRGIMFHKPDCVLMVALRVTSAFNTLPYDQAVCAAVEELKRFKNS